MKLKLLISFLCILFSQFIIAAEVNHEEEAIPLDNPFFIVLSFISTVLLLFYYKKSNLIYKKK